MAWSDAAQGVAFVFAMFALLIIAFVNMPGGVSTAMQDLYQQRPGLFTIGGEAGIWSSFGIWVSLLFALSLQVLIEPQVWTRINIARDFKVVSSTGLISFGVVAFVAGIPVILVGVMLAAIVPDVENADAIVSIFLTQVTTPAIAAAILGLGILAAFSTSDSIALALSTLTERDLIAKSGYEFTGRQAINLNRLLIAAWIILAAGLAWAQIGFLIDLLLLAFVMWAVIAPTALGSLFWKRATAAGAYVSLIGGYLTIYYIYFWLDIGLGPAFLNLTLNFWAPLISIVLFVVVSLVTTPPSEETIERIFEPIEKARATIRRK